MPSLLHDILNALVGGALIGAAATLLLLMNGRVAGISGIFAGALRRGDGGWRLFMLAGLLAGGLILRVWMPGAFINLSGRSHGELVIAGLLVGFGTSMAGGCTSGHGVCGISRLSPRSLVATIVFMLFGFFTATALASWHGSGL